MSFALRAAARDLRGGGRGLLLLAICLFLGTAALAGIGSLSSSILAALDGQGRQALGGDVELRVSQRRATIAEQATFAAAGALSETVRLRAMARGPAGSALVDLKAVDAGWPLIGRLVLAPGALAARPHGTEIALAPALADRIGARVGGVVRIGTARLRVVGLLAEEPDALGEGFRLGPAAIVDLGGLDATGIVQPGSLYESRYRLLLPPATDAGGTGDRLMRAFPSQGWSARTAEQATGTLRRGIDQLGQFLLLVGLASLVIAGVGVGSGVAAYLAGKTRLIATLKVLGAHSRTIVAIVLVELGIVAGGGILAGLAIGAATPWIVAHVAGDALPVTPRIAVYPAPLLVAGALGLLVTLLYALSALARARAVPAATLLRDLGDTAGRSSPLVLVGMAALATSLGAIVALTASDHRLALGFIAATLALIVVLIGIGHAIRFVVRRLPRPHHPLARLALANLHRPGAQTVRLVVALGLGFSLFAGLAVIDTSLAAEMRDAAPAKAPRFFAIDLQPGDAAAFRDAIARAAPGATIEAVPSLRGSIVALKGRRVEDMHDLPPGAWILRGDRTLTWSATLPPRNRVVAGRWWPADYRGPPLVSIGADAAQALGLHVGDTIVVGVLGVEVPAKIAALREIDWGGLGLNFAIIFSPGYIEEAPHGLLASVYAPPARDGAIARAVGTALPSVTLVRVGDVIGQIGDLLGRITLAIRAAAGVAVAAGIAVLIGAVAASAQGRRRDAVLLKLLGGTRRQVLIAQALEWGVLAAILALVALGIGAAAGWYVVTHVFKLPFAPGWGTVVAIILAAAFTTLAVGVLGSLPAARARPAESLRNL